jgi:hypothetical protein
MKSAFYISAEVNSVLRHNNFAIYDEKASSSNLNLVQLGEIIVPWGGSMHR